MTEEPRCGYSPHMEVAKSWSTTQLDFSNGAWTLLVFTLPNNILRSRERPLSAHNPTTGQSNDDSVQFANKIPPIMFIACPKPRRGKRPTCLTVVAVSWIPNAGKTGI